VQRRHLFGLDFLTGKDYGYRKDWVRDRFRELAGAMAIDILDYAILDNHLHVVLRNRPDIVATWSDQEVVRRWWRVCPLRRNPDGTAAEPKPCELGLLLQKVDQYRSRLSDISWLMRLACQPIARRANKEDEVDGRFFAQRFGCKRLETIVDILSCSIYVDLNVIHAGAAQSPETSRFTSAFDRIRARWQTMQGDLGASVSLPSEAEADAWLAPIFLDERAVAYAEPTVTGSDAREGEQRAVSPSCNPIGAPRISNKGFLPLTRDQYLSLLDVLGRVVRAGKRGFIPPELPPILERLRLDARSWLESIWDLLCAASMATPAVNTSG
jgi:hypothetical protein